MSDEPQMEPHEYGQEDYIKNIEAQLSAAQAEIERQGEILKEFVYNESEGCAACGCCPNCGVDPEALEQRNHKIERLKAELSLALRAVQLGNATSDELRAEIVRLTAIEDAAGRLAVWLEHPPRQTGTYPEVAAVAEETRVRVAALRDALEVKP